MWKSLTYSENYQKVRQRHGMSKHCWENDAHRLQRRVMISSQVVKNAVLGSAIKQGTSVFLKQTILIRFKIGKGACQGCILSPYLFNLYAEYIMQNAGLHEAQAGIKIAGRNINNHRYDTDDTTLIAESKEKLKTS